MESIFLPSKPKIHERIPLQRSQFLHPALISDDCEKVMCCPTRNVRSGPTFRSDSV